MKKKDDEIDKLVNPKKTKKERKSAPEPEPEPLPELEKLPEKLVLKSGIPEDTLKYYILQSNPLAKELVNLTALSAQAAQMPDTKETSIFCAMAIIRAADYFFISSGLSVEGELAVIHDLVRLCDKLASENKLATNTPKTTLNEIIKATNPGQQSESQSESQTTDKLIESILADVAKNSGGNKSNLN
jgi:hypothetical protein